MQIIIRFLCIIAATLALIHPIRADEGTDAKRVQDDVKKISHALFGGDVDTVLRYTHPVIVKMIGGDDAARQGIQKAIGQFTELDMRIESFEFPMEPTFIENKGSRFAIVPTLLVVSANGQRVESSNFQLGVFDNITKHWHYVEGSRVNQKNLQTLFPDFPEDFEFPPVHRKKL